MLLPINLKLVSILKRLFIVTVLKRRYGTPKLNKYNKLLHITLTGKGLTVCVSVLGGDFTRRSGDAFMAKQNLRSCMNEEKVKGFVDVLVTHIVAEGLSHL